LIPRMILLITWRAKAALPDPGSRWRDGSIEIAIRRLMAVDM
jgi:hypothetical protein